MSLAEIIVLLGIVIGVGVGIGEGIGWIIDLESETISIDDK